MIRPTEPLRQGRRPRRPSQEIELTVHEVELPGLPPHLSGISVAQLSDLHRGCGRTDALIETAIRRVNGLNADIVALTGDFVDGDKGDVLPAARMVASIRARLAVCASLGNHDHRADPLLMTSALEAAGIVVLVNRSQRLACGLQVAGLDDIYEGKPDVEATIDGLDPGEPALLLSHHPGALDRVPPHLRLLILSGHTHGGQIVLPFPTPEMICWRHLRTRYVQGWFECAGARLYVNRGIGVTGRWPFARRYHCPPEIALFRLLAPRSAQPHGM